MLLFELSQDHLDLAQQEVLSLIENPRFEVKEHFLLVKNELSYTKVEKFASRLALTKRISRIIFVAKKNKVLSGIKHFSWKRIYQKDICIRGRGILKNQEKEFADKILSFLPKKVINLENAKTKIEFMLIENLVYACQTLKDVYHDFEKRKAHKRPALHPSALDPKLARAMVNLTGITHKEDILTDPFVGTGGMLLEAEDLGFKSQGFDIDDEMIERCKKNLEYFNTKYALIKKQDATQIKEHLDYVVSDMPYGKMTKNIPSTLYDEFFKNLKKILGKRAVLCFEDKPETLEIIKKNNFKIVHSFSLYVHKSMQRRIVVLEQL